MEGRRKEGGKGGNIAACGSRGADKIDVACREEERRQQGIYSHLPFPCPLYYTHTQIVFVEALDKCFENVCELDLIFHSDKVRFYYGLEER